MAHQAHKIPWTLLADHLHFVHEFKKDMSRTNFYFVKTPERGKKLTYFVKAVEKNIKEFASTERKKFPKEFVLPEDKTERVIPDSTVSKIQRTVAKARRAVLTYCYYNYDRRVAKGLKSREDQITNFERTWEFWTMTTAECCNMYDRYGEECSNATEMISSMLIHDEMETLLHIASNPESLIRRKWQGNECKAGWRLVARLAVYSYLTLNLIILKPETYDPNFKSPATRGGNLESQDPSIADGIDYRVTYAYKKTQTMCTSYQESADAALQPHRIFYGLSSHGGYWWTKYWMSPYAMRRNREIRGNFIINPTGRHFRVVKRQVQYYHVPTARDCESVANILGQLGLPLELCIEVMGHAEYNPPCYTRLLEPYDPMHPSNREELKKYLSFCWKLIYKSEMLASECGIKINWQQEFTSCIVELFGRQNDKTFRLFRGRNLQTGLRKDHEDNMEMYEFV